MIDPTEPTDPIELLNGMKESTSLGEAEDAAGLVDSTGQRLPLHFDAADAKFAMLQDLDYFAGIALPEVCTAPFSPLHHSIWQELTTAVLQKDWNGVARYAVGIPRGHAKTQLIKLLILFIILFTDIRFILVVCHTHGMANNLLNDVCDMLDSENIITLFGDWRGEIEKDNNENTIFTFLGRYVILKPQGAGGAIRGANIKNTRPEVIICDDMQAREEALSQEVAKKNLEWFSGTLYKARSFARCAFFYIGNMYPDLEIGGRGSNIYGCILRNLQLNPDWKSWIGAAITSDGLALWEDVFSLKDLLAELRQDTQFGQPEIFWSELMNDPKAKGSNLLDVSKIKEHLYVEGVDLVAGKFLIIDPSLGKKKSDDQMVGMFYVYDADGPVFREARNIKKSAPELVKEVLIWALTERIPLICAESVAYQATLIQWFVHFIDMLEIEGISVVGVTPRGVSKASRILASFKSYQNGTIILHPDVRPLVISQAMMYDPARLKNVDDLLDIGAYSEYVFVTYPTEYILPLDHIEVANPKQRRLRPEVDEPVDYATYLEI
jgi:hypothetical protein